MKFSHKKYIIFTNILLVLILASLSVFSIQTHITNAFSETKSPIFQGDTERNQVTLMFNVYWGEEHLDGILKTLKENQIKTTFFIGGTWADKRSAHLKQIESDGHEIANHGYFHKEHSKLNLEDNKKEILNAEKMIEKMCGKKTTLFAPPSGDYSKETLKAAESLGYRVIMWSKDTVDWRDKDASLILKRATTNIKNGDLILMHPTKSTLEALPKIIANLKEKGFDLVTVSENLSN